MEATPKLVEVEYDTYENAYTGAAQEAATSMSAMAPAILYHQGNRSFITTSFPLSYIAERVRIDNLARGGNANDHYNRPLIPEHHKAITDYVINQDDYVLPSLSLCVEEQLRCHVPRSSSAVKMGIVVLPSSIIYNVTDGQHRTKAIKDALAKKASLLSDGIGVTIVVEHDMEHVHQIFYDHAQTRAIPSSLLTVYNRRDRLAKLVREVCEDVPVFNGRIEQVSKTVGKSSTNIFTLNQLRVGVAELLTGDSTQGGIALRKELFAMLDNPKTADENKRWVVDFFNAFTLANPQWATLFGAGDPASVSIDTSELRGRYVHFSGTGMTVLCRVGYYIRNYPTAERERLIEGLGGLIDWSRDAEIWQGNIINNGRMNTQRWPVDLAVIEVKNRLKILLTAHEIVRATSKARK